MTEITAKLLSIRNIKNIEDINNFLNPSIKNLFTQSCNTLLDMEKCNFKELIKVI